MGYQGLEDLDVWKKSRELKIEIAQLVKTFPPEERYRLITRKENRLRPNHFNL